MTEMDATPLPFTSATESFAELTKLKKQKKREKKRHFVDLEQPNGHSIHVEVVSNDNSRSLTWPQILIYTLAVGCCLIMCSVIIATCITYYHDVKEHQHLYVNGGVPGETAFHDNSTTPYVGVD